MYAVFLFGPEASRDVPQLLQDDLVSRQSISVRDARALGSRLEGTLVLIEGTEGAVKRFRELSSPGAKRLGKREAEEVYELLRKEEEDAAEGVGMLFG